MKKFLLFFCAILLPVHVWAGVGNTDSRYYVTDEMWATEPYNKFVYFIGGVNRIVVDVTSEYDYAYTIDKVTEKNVNLPEFVPVSTCTAQYISPNLILSAGHCRIDFRQKYDLPNTKCEQVAYKIRGIKNGKLYETPAKLVYTEYQGWAIDKLGDWAVWMVTDPDFYSDAYFDIKTPTKTIDVINAGWGWARIFSDEELTQIRDILSKTAEEVGCNDGCPYGIRELQKKINTKLQNLGIEKLSDNPNRLKASTCQIVFEDCVDIAKDYVEVGQASQEFDEMSGAFTTNPEFNGLNSKPNPLRNVSKFLKDKLKSICDNQIRMNKAKKYPYILATTCDSWGGNSGGGYISTDGKYIYGTCSYGSDGIEDAYNATYMVSAKQFETKIQKLIKKYDHNNPVEENIAKIPSDFYYIQPDCKDIDKNGEYIDMSAKPLSSSIFNQDILEQRINKALPNIKNMTTSQFLKFLDDYVEYDVNQQRIEQLQKKYDDARANEQSLANRTLSSLTMAATGIGGMELAMGLSQQKADKAAEADMTAYLSTFQCKVGDKRYKGTDKNIEIPGANQLTKMYQEYADLAASIKERKAALGLKPGIEAEVVLDKANMGLYNDVGHGIENGTYASLYRASKGNENDTKKLQEDKDSAKKRVTAGGVVGGVGAVGGAVGNSIINGELGEKIQSLKSNGGSINFFGNGSN